MSDTSVTVSDLFEVTRGSAVMLLNLKKSAEGTPYVSASARNNGVTARVEPGSFSVCAANTISVAVDGSILEAFVQPVPFISAPTVKVLVPKRDMSLAEMLWWVTCIRANRYRYSYGRKAHRTLGLLQLPAGVPSYVQSAVVPDASHLRAPAQPGIQQQLEPEAWKTFSYSELFDIRKGKRLTKQQQTPGQTAFIGSSEKNNGVTARIGTSALHPAGCLTVSYNGSVGEAFYQPEPFYASDDVNVFYPRHGPLTVEAALFICTLIRHEAYRYDYGRKWTMEHMRVSTLRLPVTLTGEPDWGSMVAYIKSLPYSSALEEAASLAQLRSAA